MAVKFTVKVKMPGMTHDASYLGKDGKNVSKVITEAVESSAYNLMGQKVIEAGKQASLAFLYRYAVFFQRVVSRTPWDEDYIAGWSDDKGLLIHRADDDHVRDYWTISHGTFSPITARYLRESRGCTFFNFNDKKEIEIIYKEMLKFMGKEGSKFWSGTATLKTMNIENTHPDKKRISLLEYGGYPYDDTPKKEGEYYPHGITSGYSYQAPAGMFRITQDEMEAGSYTIPNDVTKMNIGHPPKIKSPTAMAKVRKILGGKLRITEKELKSLEECFA